jgi:actin-related protein 8
MHSEYLKRDDQYLSYRTNQEAMSKEREGATNGYENGIEEDTIMEDSSQEPHGSKVIVIHPGSLNLRIGLAYDAVPKTVPMCIARKDTQTELEANSTEAVPRRVGVDGTIPPEPERWFGDEVCCHVLSETVLMVM